MHAVLRRRAGIATTLAVLALLLACRKQETGTSGTTTAPAGAADFFVDRATEVGLNFVHDAGRTGQFYFPEVQGAGGTFLDFDDDGDLDVFFVQSGSVEQPGKTADGSKPALSRLYRNDSTAGGLRFTDVTEASGIRTRAYGQGVAIGDYDNDGRIDLLVSQLGAVELWHNEGDGKFRETAQAAGVASPFWNTSSTFFDYDRDGWLDLYVATYTDFTLATHKRCSSTGGNKEYCGPMSFRDQPDKLFHNRGDGTFEDVSQPAGILAERGPGLGVIALDADQDGWLDLWVANDEKPNFLWRNKGDGTFENTAVLAGCAVDRNGKPHSGMGVDVGDTDNDGDEDLWVTNLETEYHTFYENHGDGLFEDRTVETGLAGPTIPFTGFGTAFFDYDNDGWLDIFTVNGAVRAQEAFIRAGDPFPYQQKNQLLRNKGDGTFEDVSAKAGVALTVAAVGRGASFGDVDNDGDTDILITNDDGPARLMVNQVGAKKQWLGLRLMGQREKRDMFGAKVTVIRREGPSLARRSRADGSYQSGNDPRVLFGLGDRPAFDAIRVTWPDGKVEEWKDVPPGRYTTLVSGTGQPPAER